MTNQIVHKMNWFDLGLVLGSIGAYVLIIASFSYLVLVVGVNPFDVPPVLLFVGSVIFIVGIVITAQEALEWLAQFTLAS